MTHLSSSIKLMATCMEKLRNARGVSPSKKLLTKKYTFKTGSDFQNFLINLKFLMLPVMLLFDCKLTFFKYCFVASKRLLKVNSLAGNRKQRSIMPNPRPAPIQKKSLVAKLTSPDLETIAKMQTGDTTSLRIIVAGIM